MGVAIWLFLLLLVVPTALHESAGGAAVLVYLFSLNVAAGYLFWTGRRLGELGAKSAALAYLASGVIFFSLLVDPVRIDTAEPGSLASWDGWQSAMQRAIEDEPHLVGSPVEQGAVRRRAGVAHRPWIEGFLEDVVLDPEAPR